MNVMGTIEKGFGKVNATVFRQVNRVTDWWNLPTPVALLNLRGLRDDLRESNLFDTRGAARQRRAATTDDLPEHRTYDGSRQDPTDPEHGQGRHAASAATRPPRRPSPSRCRSGWSRTRARSPTGCCCATSSSRRPPERARRLLDPVPEPRLVRPRRERPRHLHRGRARRRTTTGPTATSMKVTATIADRTRTGKSGLPPTFVNTVTHWWDLSQIYGSTEERNRELRSRRGRQAQDRERDAPERDRARSSTAST